MQLYRRSYWNHTLFPAEPAYRRQALCLGEILYFFITQRSRDAKELPSPSVRRGGQEDLLFFSQRRSSCLPEALRLGAFASIFPFLEIRILFFFTQRLGARLPEALRPACERQAQRNCLPFAAADYFTSPRLLISFRQALSQRFAASRAFFS